MLPDLQPTALLVSCDPNVLELLEPVLFNLAATTQVVPSLEAALQVIANAQPQAQPPLLVLIDLSSPRLDSDMSTENLLEALRGDRRAGSFSIVAIAGTLTQEGIDLHEKGLIEDMILRTCDVPWMRLRIQIALRNRLNEQEIGRLREAQVQDARMESPAGVYDRESMLAILFRETDRVQRMNSNLCLLRMDMDDFGQWNQSLSNRACDDLVCQIAARINRLLRSYDALGRSGSNGFLLGLPGCSAFNGMTLAERIRLEVFSRPFWAGGESIRLSACFGIASSHGRSPVVVLREAEQALQSARGDGNESIQCYGDFSHASNDPGGLIGSTGGNRLIAW